jgi:hypothetical protein
MKHDFSSGPRNSWIRKKLNATVLAIQLTGIRVTLAAYFLTFGLYGYGSDLQLAEPLTFLPLLSGLLISIYLAKLPSDYFEKWTYRLTLKVKHALAFLGIFALLIISSNGALENELVGDELSYVQLSVVHSLKLVELADFLDQSTSVGPLLQLVSLLILLGLIVPFLIFVSLAPLRTAIILVAAAVFVMQVGYATLGGWGWGYAKVAWLPYLVPVGLFGPEPIVFRMTSLAIVAVGFSGLFFSLRILGIKTSLRGLILLALISLSVPSLFYSSLDHVVFFVAIAMPTLVLLIAKPSSQTLHGVFLLLSIGTLFRVSISFLIIALAFWALIEKPHRLVLPKLWSMAQPGLLVLVPYGLGFLVSPPVFSSDRKAEVQMGTQAEEIVSIFQLQLGILESSIVVFALMLAFISRRVRLPLVVFYGLVFAFYFVLLNQAGLVGGPKYSTEWALPLLVISLALLGMESPKVRERFTLRIAHSITVTSILTLIFLGNQFALDSNFGARIKSAPEQLRTYSPIGYTEVQNFLVDSQTTECVPVGVVYGAGNEILANRTVGVVKFAREAHFELQAAQLSSLGDWTVLSGEVADASRFDCLYGSEEAFLNLGTLAWKDWDKVFSAKSVFSGAAVVLQR